MKAVLHFLNESDFQAFASQLFGEEMPNFMAIEGAGGDGGLDGIEGTTIYQMYFPEEKNRTKQRFLKKIDSDIPKARATADAQGISATDWVLVVPEDLSTDVTLHLIKKAKEHGFSGRYWGASKLSALASKYPHVKDAFPGVFLPEIKSNIERIDQGVDDIKNRMDAANAEIMTDAHFTARMQNFRQRQQQDFQSLSAKVGHNSSAQQQIHHALNLKYQPMILDLQQKKAASDRLYELEVGELKVGHDKRRNEINEDHQARGVYDSGMRINALRMADEELNAAAEKLALKYGKPFTEYPVEPLP